MRTNIGKRILAGAVIAALGSTAPAGAVTLNPRGTGQVLVYPYYTVNAGFSTLLSVVNTTANGKALKLRFREGYNGRYVLDFNVYLSPYDAWVGQIFDIDHSDTGPAGIATSDNSCSVPLITAATGPGQGIRAVPFRDLEYSPPNGDGGPTGPARTREGYFEIIEMGEVTDGTHQTLQAILHDQNGVPEDCNQLLQAWINGGYWAANPGADLTPPAGGLYGAESIINVAEGTIYTVNAIAIDGFSNTVQHTRPGDESGPDLNTASRNAAGRVSAFVPVGAALVQADYDKPEDAISALFMADALYNEYVVDPGVGAASDWIVTFPTKRFYTDTDLLAGAPARAPFDTAFANGSCAPIQPQLFNREALTTPTCGGGLPCPQPANVALCFAANSLTIGTSDSVLGSNLRSGALIDTQDAGFTAGHLRVSLTHDNTGAPVPRHALTSANGVTLTGLPATGFLGVDYVNANVTPGVLANYSGAYPHRATVACTGLNAPQDGCP